MVRTFETYQEMLGEFWNENVTDAVEIALVSQLTQRLIETESIWAPLVVLKCDDQVVSRLCSKGVIERRNNQLRFTHQTIQEYAVARLFAESDTSLSGFVLADQKTIFQRPTIWAVLNYLRQNASDKYQHEVDVILQNGPRLHVRYLLIDFMCRQDEPIPYEIAEVGQLVNDKINSVRVLTGIKGRKAWFHALNRTHFPAIMRNQESEQWPMLALLSHSWEFDWERTFELVRDHWANDGAFDAMTLRVMEYCGNWNEDALPLVEKVMVRAKRNHGLDYQIEKLVGVVSADVPDAGARLAARVIVTEEVNQTENRSRRSSPLVSQERWHDLEEIARAAPLIFLAEIAQWLVVTAEEYHSGYEGSVLRHYAGDYMAFEDRQSRRESPVLNAIRTCVEVSSQQEASEFVRLIRACWESQNALVHQIVIDGMINVAEECPDDAFEYLMGDDRRFSIGPHGDTQDSQSAKLIGTLYPKLSDGQRGQLIERVMKWTKYKPDVELCDEQLVWDRESRLHLLLAIPAELVPPFVTEFINSEKAALLNWDRKIAKSHSGWVKTIPPITEEEMESSTDDVLLEAFSRKKPNGRAWKRVEGGFEEQGGSEASSSELAKLAKSNPLRAAEIIRMLVAKGANAHLELAMEGFAGCSDREFVFELIKDISVDCDENEDFRSSVSRLLSAHIDDDGLPEEIVRLLEAWLQKPWDHTRSVVVDRGKREWKPDESLLWASWGSMILDTDKSYYTLETLTRCLLRANNPLCDRWIEDLTAHLANQVSFKTWRMFCDRLQYVRAKCCDPAAGKTLVTKLFEKFPILASEMFGCRLLAQLGGFLDSEFLEHILSRLLASTDPLDQQAAGELLGLFALREDTSSWAMPILDGQLEASEAPLSPFLIGVAYTAANLWHDLDNTIVCSRIIKQVIGYADSDAVSATRQLFWNANGLPANEETRSILDALAKNVEAVDGSLTEEILGLMADMLPHLRPQILEFCKRIVEERFDELRQRQFNAYQVGPFLVEIAMTLQRFADTRSEALDLFETLLRAGLDEADRALKDVDAVDELSLQQVRTPRRRRRQNRRKTE